MERGLNEAGRTENWEQNWVMRLGNEDSLASLHGKSWRGHRAEIPAGNSVRAQWNSRQQTAAPGGGRTRGLASAGL